MIQNSLGKTDQVHSAKELTNKTNTGAASLRNGTACHHVNFRCTSVPMIGSLDRYKVKSLYT